MSKQMMNQKVCFNNFVMIPDGIMTVSNKMLEGFALQTSHEGRRPSTLQAFEKA